MSYRVELYRDATKMQEARIRNLKRAIAFARSWCGPEARLRDWPDGGIVVASGRRWAFVKRTKRSEA